MAKKILLLIIFVILAIVSVGVVSSTNVTYDRGDYDYIVDHAKEIKTYKKGYGSYTEVPEGQIYEKTFDDGVTVKIVNKEGKRKYYWTENGQTWTKKLDLGCTNVNKEGLIVSHVILHGSVIKTEKVPDKTVKKLKSKKVNLMDFAKSVKSFKKSLNERIDECDTECCSLKMAKIVELCYYNDYHYKIKSAKKIGKRLGYNSQFPGAWKYKFSIMLYKKVPGYKKARVLHLY